MLRACGAVLDVATQVFVVLNQTITFGIYLPEPFDFIVENRRH